FGELPVSTASHPSPFLFSTKHHDPETDTLYYGYRHYSPRLGRWLSRDPLEENGGDNLLSFCSNASNGH
ncbi:MAG: RHS repeat-associated core domain-containing protein, partial [Kiritimatiellae bacterium]|nr:RHS repeat-associated core domain-containing protein [Kiritimatiellia bacterium]